MMWRGHGVKPNKDINVFGVKPNKDMNVYLETMKERGLKWAGALFELKKATDHTPKTLNWQLK
jgi:hypothetical protein